MLKEACLIDVVWQLLASLHLQHTSYDATEWSAADESSQDTLRARPSNDSPTFVGGGGGGGRVVSFRITAAPSPAALLAATLTVYGVRLLSLSAK